MMHLFKIEIKIEIYNNNNPSSFSVDSRPDFQNGNNSLTSMWLHNNNNKIIIIHNNSNNNNKKT